MGDKDEPKKGSNCPSPKPPKVIVKRVKAPPKPEPTEAGKALNEAMGSLGKAIAGGVKGFASGAAAPFAPPKPDPPKPPPLQVGKFTLPHPQSDAAKDTLQEVERQIDTVIADAVKGALDGAVRGVAQSVPKPAPPAPPPPMIQPIARIFLILSIGAPVSVLMLSVMGADIPYVEQLAAFLFCLGMTITFFVNLVESLARKKK